MRRLGVVKLCLILLLLCGSNAFADLAFNVEGSTTGQFYLGSTPLGSSFVGLAFTGSDFGPTTNPTIDLGTFNLSTLLSYYDPFDFRLSVDFVAPSAGGTVFRADLSGLVTLFGGSATVNFIDNGPRHFAFSNALGSGSFDLYITDITLRNFSSGSIVGSIRNSTFAATPEPVAVILTTTLLGGALLVFRKKLRNG